MQIICGKPKVNDMFFLKTSKPPKKNLNRPLWNTTFFSKYSGTFPDFTAGRPERVKRNYTGQPRSVKKSPIEVVVQVYIPTYSSGGL